jgi:hypothetical protein
MSVQIAFTTTIRLPVAGLNRGDTSAGQLNYHAGSSDENDKNQSENEDDKYPLTVSDKSKMYTLSLELAHFDGNVCSAWKSPAGVHQRMSE